MKWLAAYLIIQLIIFLTLWIFSKRKDKRYKTKQAKLSNDFVPTEEVSIDPISQVITRVYINPITGERKYIEEK